MTTPLPLNLYQGAFQFAYVTTDIERAIALYREHYGIARFLTVPLTVDVTTPAGLRSANILMALGNINDIQVELIQPIEGNLTLYADALPAGPAFALRFHHVGCRFRERAQWDAFRAGLNPARHKIAMESTFEDHQSHYLYLDERDRLGHYLEYMWLDAAASAFFDTIPNN